MPLGHSARTTPATALVLSTSSTLGPRNPAKHFQLHHFTLHPNYVSRLLDKANMAEDKGCPETDVIRSRGVQVLASLLLPDLVSTVPASHVGLHSTPRRAASTPALSPSPVSKCYTLSITGQHQSTPGAYTPDYCRYRFLNRKIYSLNIAVNTGKSIGMSQIWLLQPAKPNPPDCFDMLT